MMSVVLFAAAVDASVGLVAAVDASVGLVVVDVGTVFDAGIIIDVGVDASL